jgi:uncharacterized membrane-anchored protein
MFAASALGTNLGDFWVDDLSLDRLTSFTSLAVISGLAIWSDTRIRRRTETGYWLAIVALRAAATNVADFLTLNYGAISLLLAAATLLAGYFTRPDIAKHGTPRVDARYWIAMLIAGVFGTVSGDLASHTVGIYAAAALLCGLLVTLLIVRGNLAPTSVIAYWVVVLGERCAGTPFGDGLASHRAIGFGLPLAILCTGGLLLAALMAHALTRHPPGQQVAGRFQPP